MTQIQAQMADYEGYPAIASDWTEPIDKPKRRVYSIVAITISFLLMWVAPVFGGDSWMGWGMLVCLVICIWDAPASLFLLIASAGAYFVDQDADAVGMRITPTQIVALGLMLRCMISPGVKGLAAFWSSVSGWMKFMLAVFFVGIYCTAAIRYYLPAAMAFTTGLIVFLVVGMLADQIKSTRWVVIAVTAGLALAAAYYLLIWTGLLTPISASYVSKAGGEFRLSSGRVDPNYIGTIIVPCAASCMVLFVSGGAVLRQLFLLLAIVVCALACVETGSRAAFLSLGVGCVLGGIFGMRSGRGRGVRNVIILSGVAIVLIAVAAGSFAVKFSQTISRFQELGASDREAIWLVSLKYIILNPIPNPVGYSAVSEAVSHQTFLTAGVDGGLLSMFGLVGATVTSIVLAWRKVKSLARQDRVWQQAILLIMITTTLGLCAISVEGHKVMWAMFGLCGLSLKSQEMPMSVKG